MCVFCAAVPATAALGAAATARQKQIKREQTAADNTHAAADWRLAVPAERVTLLVVAGLVAGSVVYHSQISPV